jgi:hypothetical protein
MQVSKKYTLPQETRFKFKMSKEANGKRDVFVYGSIDTVERYEWREGFNRDMIETRFVLDGRVKLSFTTMNGHLYSLFSLQDGGRILDGVNDYYVGTENIGRNHTDPDHFVCPLCKDFHIKKAAQFKLFNQVDVDVLVYELMG